MEIKRFLKNIKKSIEALKMFGLVENILLLYKCGGRKHKLRI